MVEISREMTNIISKVGNKSKLSDSEFKMCNNRVKAWYITSSGQSLTNEQFEICNGYLRWLYIEEISKIEHRYYLSLTDIQFNMCNEELKYKYLDIMLETKLELKPLYSAVYRELKIKRILDDK